MLTLEQAIDRFGVEIDEHLDRQARIPVLDGLQAQGDVLVVPNQMVGGRAAQAQIPVPAAGFPVVRGENGGNTHLLMGDGNVRFDVAPQSQGSLDLGLLTVAEGATGFLIHPEHGATGIAPGTYEIRRQREQQDVIALVAD